MALHKYFAYTLDNLERVRYDKRVSKTDKFMYQITIAADCATGSGLYDGGSASSLDDAVALAYKTMNQMVILYLFSAGITNGLQKWELTITKDWSDLNSWVLQPTE